MFVYAQNDSFSFHAHLVSIFAAINCSGRNSSGFPFSRNKSVGFHYERLSVQKVSRILPKNKPLNMPCILHVVVWMEQHAMFGGMIASPRLTILWFVLCAKDICSFALLQLWRSQNFTRQVSSKSYRVRVWVWMNECITTIFSWVIHHSSFKSRI